MLDIIMNARNSTDPINRMGKIPRNVNTIMNPYYQPYISAGTSSLPTLQEQLNMLVNDPSAFISEIGKQYSQSPGYEYSYNQAMNAANQAAAAGGMSGSPMHQQQAATMAQGLANKDYYDYLNSTLGMYQKGLSGLGGLTELGYTSSNELAQSLADAFLTQEKLRAAQKAASSNGLGNILGAGVGAIGSILSGNIGSLFGGGGGGGINDISNLVSSGFAKNPYYGSGNAISNALQSW